MENSTKAWLISPKSLISKGYVVGRDAFTAKRNYWRMGSHVFRETDIEGQNHFCNRTDATRCYEMDGKIKNGEYKAKITQ